MLQEPDPETPPERGPAYLQRYIRELKIEAELIAPGVPMVTVTDAARAIGADDEQILKSLLFWDRATRHNVLAIASGMARSTSRSSLPPVAYIARVWLRQRGSSR